MKRRPAIYVTTRISPETYSTLEDWAEARRLSVCRAIAACVEAQVGKDADRRGVT